LEENGKPLVAEATDFDVDVDGPEKLKGTVTPKGNGVYTITFKPTKPGSYTVSIYLFGKLVLKPFTNTISQNVGHALLEGGKAGFVEEPVEFVLSLTDSNKHPIDIDHEAIELSVAGPDKSHLGGKATKNEAGKYSLVFVPKHDGDHHVDVLVYGRSILKDKIVTSVKVGPDNAHTEVKFADGLTDGEDATFTITAKDRNGKPLSFGGAGFEAVAKGPDGKEISVAVHDNGNGTYSGSFAPDFAGKYGVALRRNGKPVRDEPYNVDIKEGADAEFSELERVAVINCAVTVKAFNKKGERKTTSGDKAEISVEGPNGPLDSQVIDNKDGTYTVKYQATPGVYKVKATLNGKNVRGSPFQHTVPNPFGETKNL